MLDIAVVSGMEKSERLEMPDWEEVGRNIWRRGAGYYQRPASMDPMLAFMFLRGHRNAACALGR